MDFVHRDIEIEVLPGDIPENITVDISELMLNQGVRVRDVMTGAKWTATSDADMMIVHVVTPRAEEAPAAATADAVAAAATAAPAEPEVIKKGKLEKPEDEPAKEKK